MDSSKTPIITQARINDLIKILDDEQDNGTVFLAAKPIIDENVDIIFQQSRLAGGTTPLDCIIICSNIKLLDYVFHKSAKCRAQILKYHSHDGHTVPLLAIYYKDKELLEYLITNTTLDERKAMFASPNAQNQSLYPLNLAIFGKNEDDLLELFVKYKINLSLIDDNGFSHQQILLIAGHADLFAKHDALDADTLATSEKVATAAAFIRYAYSPSGAYITPKWIMQMYEKLISENVEESDKKFLDALSIMQSEEPQDIGNGRKIKVVPIHYYDHVAFAGIICDEARKPLEISYCDSYVLLSQPIDKEREYYNGECRLEVKPWINSCTELEALMHKHLHDQKHDVYCDYKKLAPLFAKFVEKNADGKPLKVITENIPMHEQKIGRINCALKSTNIMMRALVLMMHPEMTYHILPDSELGGSLRDDYKRFKNKAIDISIQILGDVVCKGNQDETYRASDDYRLALQYCQIAHDKAVEKNMKIAEKNLVRF